MSGLYSRKTRSRSTSRYNAPEISVEGEIGSVPEVSMKEGDVDGDEEKG